MPTPTQGTPIWYELGSTDLAGAEAFYGRLFGWKVKEAGVPGFDYRLAELNGAMTAGMMKIDQQDGTPPPNWVIYYAVDKADDFVAKAGQAGAKTIVPPTDIPGTGRFAILADPQGAVFGVLQPLPMDGPPPGGPAFDMSKTGHGNWHELMSSDPTAGFDFYASMFGWGKGETMPMPDGAYQLFTHEGQALGGMMGLGDSPVSCWLPYFGVANTSQAIETIKAAGGNVHAGPMEVPGPAYIAVAQDPQGAWFAVVGAQK